MTGVSVGYFTPEHIVDDVERFARSVSRVIGKCHPAFPLEIRGVEGLQHAYAKVDGPIALHIDPHGKDEGDTSIFQFIFAAENRPVLLTGAAGTVDSGSDMDKARSEALLGIAEKEKLAPFTMGAIELTVGMFVHFDIATTWHGITAAPIEMRTIGMRMDPKLIIIQIVGYEAHEYAEAVHSMHKLLAADRAYWKDGIPDTSRRIRR